MLPAMVVFLFMIGLFVLIGISSLYVAVTYEGMGDILFELNFRIGDPHFIDIMMGTALVLIVVEAARRTQEYHCQLSPTCLSCMHYLVFISNTLWLIQGQVGQH